MKLGCVLSSVMNVPELDEVLVWTGWTLLVSRKRCLIRFCCWKNTILHRTMLLYQSENKVFIELGIYQVQQPCMSLTHWLGLGLKL
jgi:hypothetical protein